MHPHMPDAPCIMPPSPLPRRSALRFPGSCVAVLLYIVVAVTAAPDNHVGTRIFLCGFMIGPMWLALVTGGIVVSRGAAPPRPPRRIRAA